MNVRIRGGRKVLVAIWVFSAAVCLAEMLWLRRVQSSTPTRPQLGLLIVPWLIVSAGLLIQWHSSLTRGEASTLNRARIVFFWLVTGVFVFVSSMIYGSFVFGWF
jgi:hypothetical protein